MPNNIAVSITADVADLQVKRAVASSEVKAFQKDLDSLARSAKSGMTNDLRASMLAAADGASKARAQVALIDRDLRSLNAGASGLGAVGAGAKEAGAAMGGLHVGSAGVTRELIVLAREAGRGNFSRMAGSATILAQRLGVLTPAVLGIGAAVAAIAAPIAAFLFAAEQGSEELAKFRNAMEATNGYAGVTISQLQTMAEETAKWAHEGVGAATKELMALAESGRFTGQTLQLIGADATRMSQLTGESADKWNSEFEKMSEGVTKFAAEYQARYGQLTTAQFQYIQELERQGQKETAEYALAKDIYDYLGQKAPEQLGYLERAWRGLGNTVAGVWDQMKSVGRNTNADQVERVQGQIAYYERLRSANNGTHQYDAPLAAARQQLAALQAAERAEEKRAKDQGDATARQKEGVDAAQKLAEKFEASKASGEKLKDAIRQIDDELKKAVAADPGNKALYEQEAAAARAQAMKSDTPKGGPGLVEQWQAEFRRAQVVSNDFFGDETEKELAFWRSKAGLTTQGSKEWLEVQGHIYEASKALAHQDYQDHIADLNDRLQADKDNWAKEQADWQEKLAFIKGKHGEESSEYKNAHREFEAAEREHQRQMAEIQRDGAQEALAELKSNLDAAKTIREANARTAEAGIQSGARSSPFGEIQASQQIAALHQQLNAQQLADDQAYHSAKMAILDQELAEMEAKNLQETADYIKAVNAKKLADVEWANQQKVLSAQAAQQQAADQQKIAASWHSTIDPMVSSVGNQFKGLIEGTESWQQALVHIGEDALGMVIQAIERMVEAWIIGMFTGQAAQRTAAVSQVASYAGIAGAAGVASFAGAPYPIDLGAPAFGAAMAATAASFGSMASLAVGTNEVPADMVAQIHAGERIIPRADNQAIISALSGGASGARGGGDTHNHINYAPQVMPRGDFRQDLRNHASDLFALIQTGFRNGSLSVA